ncbi:MAG: hypothetical protein EOP00_31450 [Pedobacter sp.]|nr:MAG: hypothetical protein EOP00_31450 [Pedobacter sp.]
MEKSDLKFNTFWLLLFFFLVASAILVSCKKDKTEEVTTEQIISSEWIPSNVWVASTTSTGAGKNSYYFEINAPDVTQEIIDRGTVLVYAKFLSDPDGTNQVKLLPSIYYNLGGAATQYRFQHSISLGKIKVICDVIPAGVPSTSNQFRYVILPKGKNASSSVNFKDYNAVKSNFGLLN